MTFHCHYNILIVDIHPSTPHVTRGGEQIYTLRGWGNKFTRLGGYEQIYTSRGGEGGNLRAVNKFEYINIHPSC